MRQSSLQSSTLRILQLNNHQTPLPHSVHLLFCKPFDFFPTKQRLLPEFLSAHLHTFSISRIEEIACINHNFKEERVILQIRFISLKN